MNTLQSHITDNNNNIAKLTVFSTEGIKERTSGLLSLPTLEPHQGLLLNYCRSIHTFGMSYAIDVVYVTKQHKIIKIVHNIKPYRMSICLFAHHTLELRSGEAKRLALAKGMHLVLPEKTKEINSHP